MEKIKVDLGQRSYEIEVGCGNLFQTNFTKFNASKIAVITDSNVRGLFAEKLLELIKSQGVNAQLFEVPAGEKSKNPMQVIEIAREMVRNNFDTKSMVVAVGGGVVGDLAAFIASVYKRGIKVVHVPTTLIAQVDSSIGGKTGVDLPEGKNLVGTFYQPSKVIIDVGVLKTLPAAELKNGLAEAIKYGMSQDEELFEFLEQNVGNASPEFFLKLVSWCCSIKARVVERDERESELRKVLNYGHTVGHAIEAAELYEIAHGAAVGIGMNYEARIAVLLGVLKEADLRRQNELIEKTGLQAKYSAKTDLIELMKRDKKNKLDKIFFVLPNAVGSVKTENGKIAFPVEEETIRKALEQ
ncbi:3-dehydroquinate synthase [Candidatus Micrarchaeota archaeon]|nr:3-dehydroquinate synthase [Candidatus Micrarchaeota archaeon]